MNTQALLQRVRRLSGTPVATPPAEPLKPPVDHLALPRIEPPVADARLPLATTATWQGISPQEAETNFVARHGVSSDQWWASRAIEIGAVVPRISESEGAP